MAAKGMVKARVTAASVNWVDPDGGNRAAFTDEVVSMPEDEFKRHAAEGYVEKAGRGDALTQDTGEPSESATAAAEAIVSESDEPDSSKVSRR